MRENPKPMLAVGFGIRRNTRAGMIPGVGAPAAVALAIVGGIAGAIGGAAGIVLDDN